MIDLVRGHLVAAGKPTASDADILAHIRALQSDLSKNGLALVDILDHPAKLGQIEVKVCDSNKRATSPKKAAASPKKAASTSNSAAVAPEVKAYVKELAATNLYTLQQIRQRVDARFNISIGKTTVYNLSMLSKEAFDPPPDPSKLIATSTKLCESEISDILALAGKGLTHHAIAQTLRNKYDRAYTSRSVSDFIYYYTHKK